MATEIHFPGDGTVEEEVAQQLHALCAMCRYFGWKLPHTYIACARDELLEMARVKGRSASRKTVSK